MATVQMDRFRRLTTASKTLDWVKTAVAVWLFISPWVLAYGSIGAGGAGGGGAGQAGVGNDVASALSWNAWIAAVLLAAVAIAGTLQLNPRPQWRTLTIGAWLFITPWVLAGGTPVPGGVSWNFWAVGALTFFLSAWELAAAYARPETTGAAAVRERPDLAYAGERPMRDERISH
jgi:hypothetical protein